MEMDLVKKSSGYQNATIEACCEKTGLRVSDLVRHKPGCTTTQDV